VKKLQNEEGKNTKKEILKIQMMNQYQITGSDGSVILVSKTQDYEDK
jgi:hypothetical protein